MAAFRKRNGKWQVQVRVTGARPISRTFIMKEDAQRWARETEAQIQRSDYDQGREDLKRVTLGQLVERYRDTITVRKRGCANETIILNALLRQPFNQSALNTVSPNDFARYRDERLKSVKATTINRELTLLHHVYTVARNEWGIPIENPLKGIRRAKGDLPRNRRLQEGELEALLKAVTKSRNLELKPILEFAVETGMRRGEILMAEWGHYNETKCTLHVPTTKTGHPRTIPLSSNAVAILRKQKTRKLGRPFPMTPEALRHSWVRLVKRAKLEDLHFHDLRHEAVSRFFERGLTVPEVALISGHRDPRMLFRYTHLRAEDVVKKLN